MCVSSDDRGRAMMQLGMVFLVLGALSLRMHVWAHVPEDLADGVTGLFYGVAIGCLIVSMVRARRAPGP